MRAFEKVLSLDENNLAAAEALIPLYEAGRDPKALVRVLEIQLRATRRTRARAPGAHEAARAVQRGEAARQGRGVRLVAQGARRGPRVRGDPRPRSSGSPPRRGLERSSSTRTRRRCRSSAIKARCAAADARDGARHREGAGRRRSRARDEPPDPRARRGATSRRSTRSSGSTSARGSSRICSSIYEKKLELTTDGDERIAIQSKIGQLYEDEVKDDQKADRGVPGRSSTPRGDEPIALRSLDRIYVRNPQWKELADILGRQLTIVGPDENKAAHVELKYRLGQLKEQHLGDVAGAIDVVPRHPRHRRRHPSARDVARGPPARRRHAASSLVADILEPIYEQLQEWGPLVGVHEIQLAAEKDSLRRDVAAAPHRRAAAHQAARRREGVRRVRARVPEDPSTEAAKDQLEALAPLIEDGWGRLVKLFEDGARRTRTSIQQARPRARDEGRALVRGPARQDRQGRRVLQARRSRSSPTTSTRSPRSRRSSRARRSTPSCSRSIAGASTSRRSPTSGSTSCSASPRSTRRCSTTPDEAITIVQRDPRPGARRPQGAPRPRSAVRPARRVARPRRQPQPPAHARRAAARAGRAAGAPRAAARDAPRRGRPRPSRRTARCSSTRIRTAMR